MSPNISCLYSAVSILHRVQRLTVGDTFKTTTINTKIIWTVFLMNWVSTTSFASDIHITVISIKDPTWHKIIYHIQWNLSITTTWWDTSLPSGAHLGVRMGVSLYLVGHLNMSSLEIVNLLVVYAWWRISNLISVRNYTMACYYSLKLSPSVRTKNFIPLLTQYSNARRFKHTGLKGCDIIFADIHQNSCNYIIKYVSNTMKWKL